MKAMITVDKKLAIIAGHENFGEKEIEFNVNELSKEERKELTKSELFNYQNDIYDLTEKKYQARYSIDSDLREKYEKTGEEDPGIEFIKKILNCKIKNENEQKIRNEQKSEKNAEKEKERVSKKREYIESEIGKGINTKLIESRCYNYSIDNSYINYLTENEKKLLNDLIQNKKEKKANELKEKELKKEQMENEKNEWCEEKGSVRLYKGMKAGYNINRLYIEERSELELLKFGKVYFDSKEKIEYSEKTNPSLESLQLEKKIKKAGYDCKIVWCEEQKDYGDTDHQYEAIHITFLDKYDIFITY